MKQIIYTIIAALIFPCSLLPSANERQILWNVNLHINRFLKEHTCPDGLNINIDATVESIRNAFNRLYTYSNRTQTVPGDNISRQITYRVRSFAESHHTLTRNFRQVDNRYELCSIADELKIEEISQRLPSIQDRFNLQSDTFEDRSFLLQNRNLDNLFLSYTKQLKKLNKLKKNIEDHFAPLITFNIMYRNFFKIQKNALIEAIDNAIPQVQARSASLEQYNTIISNLCTRENINRWYQDRANSTIRPDEIITSSPDRSTTRNLAWYIAIPATALVIAGFVYLYIYSNAQTPSQ